MLHPSYVDLMKVVNSGATDEEPVVQSRYSIVIATAKRAREIIADPDQMLDYPVGTKPLSIAVKELNDGAVKIVSNAQMEQEVVNIIKSDYPVIFADEDTEGAEDEEERDEDDEYDDEYDRDYDDEDEEDEDEDEEE